MENLIKQAAMAICDSDVTIALTGAGISVESGIPDFRSPGGLWSRFDPMEYATITSFKKDPEKVWNMLREMNDLIYRARPNSSHYGMMDLEQIGYLHSIITQNIDNLHQKSGSKNVIEFHGNSSTMSCLSCSRCYTSEEKREEYLPKCICGEILKPDIIFFEEALPDDIIQQSFKLAETTDTLLVLGTSATVSPANTIPALAKSRGSAIIEINRERTHLTENVSDIFLQGSAGDIVVNLVHEVKQIAGIEEM